MAVDRAHLNHAHGAHEDEHIDHAGNANLAVWLGMVAVTFTSATFVATNVYLKGWSPANFDVPLTGLLHDLPYWVTLVLILCGISVFVSGSLFVRNRWRAFNAMLALMTVLYVVAMILQFRLMLWFAGQKPQLMTIYTPTAVIEFSLVVVCVALLAGAGWYASYGNKAKINAFFPVAANVWIYTAMFGIVVLLLENVITIGQFAAWCGQHI